jgi:hypothetical protein
MVMVAIAITLLLVCLSPSWLWSYGSWIYNYLCLALRCQFKSNAWQSILNTTLCDKVCQWLATVRWFPPCTPVSFTNKTYCHNITEILLKVALHGIIHPLVCLSSLAFHILIFSSGPVGARLCRNDVCEFLYRSCWSSKKNMTGWAILCSDWLKL